MLTYSGFLDIFPEFADQMVYPRAQTDFWLALAGTQYNTDRYGASADLASALFVAHNLAMGAKDQRAAQSGNAIPGAVQGPMTSKSVGPISVSYDAGLTAMGGGGAWNATSYGIRLRTLMRAFGGPVYVPGRSVTAEARVNPYRMVGFIK